MPHKKPKKIAPVIMAGLVGNALEMYDFTLYGYFAAILANQFFPGEKSLTTLMCSYAVFASGFLLRPIGGILFGYIGDKFGRKRALEISVLLMAIPTLIIGILPGYKNIGLLAPLLLTLLRMLQGVSVGGEFVGSFSFLVEHAPKNRRGFIASWTVVGGFGGKILGTLSFAATTTFFAPQILENWGWRVPFIAGLLLALLGLVIRKKVDETPVFEQMKREKNKNNFPDEKSPLHSSIKNYKLTIFKACGALMVHTVAVYLIYVYMPVYLKTQLQIPYKQAALSNLGALFISALLFPIGGHLSDLLGRRIILILGSGALTIFAVPGFMIISNGHFNEIVIVQWIFAAIFGILHGPIPALFSELFPPHVRYTASAIAYNLCVGIFGGLTPLICTWLISITQIKYSPSFWMLALGCVSFVCSCFLPEDSLQQLLKKSPQSNDSLLTHS